MSDFSDVICFCGRKSPDFLDVFKRWWCWDCYTSPCDASDSAEHVFRGEN